MGRHRHGAALVLLLGVAQAQQGPPVYTTASAPSGACSGPRVWVTQENPSATWCCISGAWVDCTPAGGGGGAPTNASYITKVAEGGLSNEFALGSLASGILLNTTTTGVPTIYAGATCIAPNYVQAISASGAATCTTPAGGVAPPSTLAVLTGNGSGGFATYGGATCAAPNVIQTLTTLGAPGCYQVKLDDLGNPTGDKTFNLGSNHLQFGWTNPVVGPFDGAVEFQATGNFSGDLVHIHQHTGNPNNGTDLLHVESSHVNAIPVHIVALSNSNTAVIQQGASSINGVVTATGFVGTHTGNTIGVASSANQLSTLGTTTTVLHGNAAGNPAYSAVNLLSDTTADLLSVAKGGTNSSATPTTGGVGYGTGSAHAYTAAGAATTVLHGSASAPSFSGVNLIADTTADVLPMTKGGTGANLTGTVGALLYPTSTTVVGQLADVAAGNVLVSAGSGVVPAWSAATTCTSSATTSCTITGRRSGCLPVCSMTTSVSTTFRAALASTTITCTFGTSGTNTCNCICF